MPEDENIMQRKTREYLEKFEARKRRKQRFKRLTPQQRASQRIAKYQWKGSPDSNMGYDDFFTMARIAKKHNRAMKVEKDIPCEATVCEVLSTLTGDWNNAPNFKRTWGDEAHSKMSHDPHLWFLEEAGCRKWYEKNETYGAEHYKRYDKVNEGKEDA